MTPAKPEKSAVSTDRVHAAISVVVPVYNHWPLVPQLLGCLESQSLGLDMFELLLVDNGSDQIPDNINLPPWARLLHCATPGSYAARNEGIRRARGALLAFTDADCRPGPQWLARGLEYLREAGDAAIIVAGGVTVEPADWNAMSASEVYDVALGMTQARYVRHGFAMTANLFVPRRVFETAGLFDANRFSGGDAEFCRRAARHGVALRYVERAAVVHPARRDWSELVNKKRRILGGQVAAGRASRRLVYLLRALLPPVRAWGYALAAVRLPLRQRLHACWLQGRLWQVEINELFRLLRGQPPLRS